MADALERLRGIFRQDRAWVCHAFSEWFYTYHADLFVHGVPFETYIAKTEAIRKELAGTQRVLDVGAGFGVYAALLRILGIPEVIALDYHAQKVRDIRHLLAFLGLDGIRVLQGDATALPFPAGSLDGAVALASLSHVREPQAALGEIARVLRPEGRLYVFEDNNSTFPGYARKMSRMWESAETGLYPDDVPVEKRRNESYLAMRREMITKEFPALGPDQLDLCARETRGLYGRKMFGAVEQFLVSGKIVNSSRNWVCHPESGEFEEYPLNPFIVKRMLRAAGFAKLRLRSPLVGQRRPCMKLAAGVLKFVPCLLPWASPLFAVTAERRSGTENRESHRGEGRTGPGQA